MKIRDDALYQAMAKHPANGEQKSFQISLQRSLFAEVGYLEAKAKVS
ncbi:hypothetical protein [Nitrospirillum viridazoti]|nr:hypothetical protein [Nitrospirillum amazonense]